MNDSLNSNNLTELTQIKTIEQLLTSYLVTECIIEIRGERKKEIKTLAKDNLPKLQVKDPKCIQLYETFANIVNYSPVFTYLVKIGLEDIKKYHFNEDPSVIASANQDTSHLQQAFGSSFSALATVNLEEHTLHVFEEGITIGAQKGRVMQTALPMLACLFHDFGKSTRLRNEFLGDNIGKGYRAHAEVSEMYVREVLSIKYHSKFKEYSTETIELLSDIVKNHHPSQNKKRNDSMISMVIKADIIARKKELKAIKQAIK